MHWMDSVGKHNHLALGKGPDQGLTACNNHSLLGPIRLCGKQGWPFLLKPQTLHQFDRIQRAVALTKFNQIMSADRIEITYWVFANYPLQLALKLPSNAPDVGCGLSTKKGQSCFGKGQAPVRKNRLPCIQCMTNRPCVLSSDPMRKRGCTLPNHGIDFATAANGFMRSPLFCRRGDRVGVLFAPWLWAPVYTKQQANVTQTT